MESDRVVAYDLCFPSAGCQCGDISMEPFAEIKNQSVKQLILYIQNTEEC